MNNEKLEAGLASHLTQELEALRKKRDAAFDAYDKARYYQHKKELEIIYLKHGVSEGGFVMKDNKTYKVTKLTYSEPPFQVRVYGIPHILGWGGLVIPPFEIGKIEDLTPIHA